ncbi:Peroxisome chaperone and import receptor [Agyrium rufum]|nr:Peroxisome chaperone and import receptor [Agyrium rufum]
MAQSNEAHDGSKVGDTTQAPFVDDVPDPDEDDLDELDDLLDEFSSTKLDQSHKSPPNAPLASGPGRPSLTTSATEPLPSTTTKAAADLDSNDADPEEFAKQLQEQMAQLMGEIDESPEMRAQIQALMKEFESAAEKEIAKEEEEGGKLAKGGSSTSGDDSVQAGTIGTSTGTAAQEDSFQETIRKTMERMQASGDQATAAAASASTSGKKGATDATSDDDFLAQMLKQMSDAGGAEGLGAGAGEGGNDEDFSKMLMTMMEQLTNKEILYEPMKELDGKFPGWMEKNKGTGKVSEADLKRYEEQQRLVKEIVGRFEKPGYRDENVDDREFIVDRMQKMQAAGSPPPDLVGDMGAAQEALEGLDSGCPQQ